MGGESPPKILVMQSVAPFCFTNSCRFNMVLKPEFYLPLHFSEVLGQETQSDSVSDAMQANLLTLP